MNRIRPADRTGFLRAMVLSLAVLVPVPARTAEPGLSGDRLLDHVKYLASDDLEGRATGEAGCERAADYIAGLFREAGLAALPGMDDFHQVYETSIAVALGADNHLDVPAGDGTNIELTVEKDFVPFAFSGSADVTAPVLFVGYGITAPEYGYDDYAGMDATGKIVLAMRHEPRENDEASPFDGRRNTKHAEFRVKARNAADHGAAAILIVDDPLNHEPKDESLVPFGSGIGSEGQVSIPAVQIRREFAERLWGAGLPARPENVETVQKEIDDAMAPRSFVVSEMPVHVATSIREESKPTANVVGWLPPTAPSTQPAAAGRPAGSGDYIVIGAHYDHLGYGGTSSLAPDKHEIHNGADDNASGTSGLIEIARTLAQDPAPRKRGVVFVAFSGEEIGLRGSSWFVNHPPFPLENAAAMLNMDMIGRLRDEKLTIGGVGTSPLFRPMLDRLSAGRPLKVEYSESGYGPSDHNSFYAKNVPVLFFFTGAHEDYHRPSDDWNKINTDGMVQVAGLALDVARELIESGEDVPFAKAPEDTTERRSYGAGSGSGAWLGIIPGYGTEVQGVEITGVREGGPAEAGGMRGGDILVGFAGKDVANIYDLQDGLDRSRPDDVVDVIVMRNGERVTLSVTLGRKK